LRAKPNVEEVDSLVQKLSSVSEKNKAELLNKISFAYLYLDSRKAQNYAEQALELAIKRKDRKEEGTAYLAMGSNYFLRGEYEACLPLLKQGLLIGKDLNDRKLITNSLNSLGAYYNKIGDFKKAVDTYEEALDQFIIGVDFLDYA
jgi:tetratricopeptide (TPR) repeat protein